MNYINLILACAQGFNNDNIHSHGLHDADHIVGGPRQPA